MTKRYMLALVVSAFCATPAFAQENAGPVELSVFGRHTWFSADRPLDNAFGFGGGLGVYLSNRFRLAADVSHTSSNFAGCDANQICFFPADPLGGDATYTPLHIRLFYEQPLGGDALRLMLGTGWVHNFYSHAGTDDDGIGSAAGLKLRMSRALSLYAQVTHDWMPPKLNPRKLVVIGEPPFDTIFFFRRSDVHMGVEAGLSFRLGGKSEAPAPVVVAPPPPPVTPPVTPPPPPPPAQQPPPAPVQQPTAPVIEPKFVVLVPVHFDFDRADIRADAREILLNTVKVLNANGSAELEVIGNTDERGTDSYNARLGRRRAEAVKAFLIANGVAASRLEVVSKGESEPAAEGHNEAAWAENRRVDFRVKGNMQLRTPN